MNEMTESGPKGKGKGGKPAGKEADTSVEAQVSRMLIRALWAQDWAAANPDAKPADRKAAWKEARADQLEKNLKTYRKALGALARAGVVMTITPAATEEDAGEEA